MKNRIKNIFRSLPFRGDSEGQSLPWRGDLEGSILSIYCTAGYPRLDDTRDVIKALADHGADIIEIGIPFSDPLADGPVIQKSNSIAIANGMNIAKLFEQLRGIRVDGPDGIGNDLPLVLMGYMNPVLQYGFEKFCADAAACGIDGLILPDLPAHEFETQYGSVIKKYGLDFIFLITPETTDERVRKLDALSTGFLYAVSASGTTGASGTIQPVDAYLDRLKGLGLRNPILVGFGIGDKSSYDAVCRHVPGAIVGSAYIRALEKNPDVNAATKSFISSLRD